MLIQPANKSIMMPEQFQNIQHLGTSGSVLPSHHTSQTCALLVHGLRSNRQSMIQRAFWLHKNHITSILIDLKNHGETQGNAMTFGIEESKDVDNALDYEKNVLKCEQTIAIGQSLGGASILFSQQKNTLDAIVIESVFADISTAINNRLSMQFGSFGSTLAPLLSWQIPTRLNLKLEDISPEHAIQSVRSPIFIISGNQDKHATLDETLRLHQAANEPKQLWIIDGAKHQDLYRFNPSVYQEKVWGFIQESMAITDTQMPPS